MIWVGRLSSDAVAAVGTAGFFTWLASAIILISRVGAEVGVSQSVGRREPEEAKRYIRHSIQLIVVLSLVYAAFLIIFRKPLIGFYQLGSVVEQAASNYLVIISLGMLPFTLNPVFTAIFNGTGDSTTPFMINVVGLITNIILDPILIFGLGPIPRMETAGAAIATVIAQLLVTFLFFLQSKRRPELFSGLHLFKMPDMGYLKRIVVLGLPVAVQSGFFTLIAMVIARIIAQWGPYP